MATKATKTEITSANLKKVCEYRANYIRDNIETFANNLKKDPSYQFSWGERIVQESAELEVVNSVAETIKSCEEKQMSEEATMFELNRMVEAWHFRICSEVPSSTSFMSNLVANHVRAEVGKLYARLNGKL
jgi:hypothetical protein